MSPRIRVEGYAVVSADGMLADRTGKMPDSLKIDADAQFFTAALERAALVVHGRNSHEQQQGSDRRRRLILSRRIADLATHPSLPLAKLWNPAGASFAVACRAIGVMEGMAAVTGGAEVFRLFLEIGFYAFHLSRVGKVRLPGGRPVCVASMQPVTRTDPSAKLNQGFNRGGLKLASTVLAGRV